MGIVRYITQRTHDTALVPHRDGGLARLSTPMMGDGGRHMSHGPLGLQAKCEGLRGEGRLVWCRMARSMDGKTAPLST